jgi:phospholipase/lecithinase/hemolysin
VWYDGPLLDVVHPTAAGHRQLAEQILDRLVQEEYLPPPPRDVDRSSSQRTISAQATDFLPVSERITMP